MWKKYNERGRFNGLLASVYISEFLINKWTDLLFKRILRLSSVKFSGYDFVPDLVDSIASIY